MSEEPENMKILSYRHTGGLSQYSAATDPKKTYSTDVSESCPPGTSYNERTGQCEAGGGCFPGRAELSMIAGGKKKMEDLKIGDKIRTSSTSFSAILGWLDKDPGRMTNFL